VRVFPEHRAALRLVTNRLGHQNLLLSEPGLSPPSGLGAGLFRALPACPHMTTSMPPEANASAK
jgi:hypothetical protein